VLIDEFQDTDPVQWEIVWRAFGGGSVTLVLIADPKQAIYAFRGADVYAYLEAARSASTRATLRVNRRSDQPLLDAFDVLFGDAKLGHPEIAYRQVRASDAHQKPRLVGAPSAAALRVRVLSRDQPGVELTAAGYAQAGSARECVAKDLAADVVALLRSGAEIERRAPDASVIDCCPVSPGDIAVLVQSHRNAALVAEELGRAAVPAVINGAGSVFASAAALDWLRVLQALERPAYSARARSAALTPLLGWSAARVAQAGEEELEELHQRLHSWARVLRLRGVAALADTIFAGERVPARVLTLVDGERELTDLQHVAQLLHAAASSEQLGTAALASWLRQRIADAAIEGGREDLTRRLESDADAVQVLTIHRSKGLEFPIVYAPFLWEPGWIPEGARPVYFHDPAAGDARAIDVGLEGPSFREHAVAYRDEERGEDLRLMYVALTRARHQAVVWWAGSFGSRDSPLGRLMFARDDDGNVRPVGAKKISDQAALERFGALAAEAGGSIAVEPVLLGGLPTSWGGGPAAGVELAAASFHRTLDERWRRTSYSDITAAAHDAFVGSEPEVDVVTDEPSVALPVAEDSGGEPGAVPSPLGSTPTGARVGTFIHRVLAASDFSADDLVAELSEQVAAEQAGSRLDIGDASAVVAGLVAAIETPVDGALRLRDVARGDRLDELGFELPLAGGDTPAGRVTLAAVSDVLRACLAPDDPLAGYAERLHDPSLRRDVRGYLTGSIDLVVRLADGRYAIADYKTNWLGGIDDQLTTWHYRPEALRAEMVRAHYGLQALLYVVALHRFLRWRVPGYAPARDLGGVHYLFIRGMVGTGTPVLRGGRCGVFTWHPPGELVVALSDVLDGGESA
jgi:exodeoxyribonuclease V beta subunit